RGGAPRGATAYQSDARARSKKRMSGRHDWTGHAVRRRTAMGSARRLRADEHHTRSRRQVDCRHRRAAQEERLTERDVNARRRRRVDEGASVLPVARVYLSRARTARRARKAGSGIEAVEPAERRSELVVETVPPRADVVDLGDAREAFLREEVGGEDVPAVGR